MPRRSIAGRRRQRPRHSHRTTRSSRTAEKPSKTSAASAVCRSMPPLSHDALSIRALNVALVCMGGDRCRRPGDHRAPCEASLVAARNVNADTDGSIHGAAGRRASAAASRHARSDRTGTTAEGRTAWQQSRRRHRQAARRGAFSGGHQSSHCPTVPDLFDERRQLAMRSGRRLGVAGGRSSSTHVSDPRARPWSCIAGIAERHCGSPRS